MVAKAPAAVIPKEYMCEVPDTHVTVSPVRVQSATVLATAEVRTELNMGK